jgi:D-serine deaminase-like pyridoxal phosphate-dependent protein
MSPSILYHFGVVQTRRWSEHHDLANADLSWQYKGWPLSVEGADLSTVGALGLNLFRDNFMFPVMVLAEDAMAHNISTVARFCAEHDISLAPHGKTTMSPELALRQLEAGAWAITASTASQARIFRAFGVPRILIAHQVIDPAGVLWMWDELATDPEAELICLVDSLDGVRLMEAALDGRPAGRPIDVLVELGMLGGRTGCRTIADAVAVAERISVSDRLRLVGAEGYEGIIHYRGDDFSEVDRFLTSLRALVDELSAAGRFDHLDEVIVTAGGSMFPDRVAAVLGSGWQTGRPVRPVIRPGGYVTHDSVLYAVSGPFGVREPMASYDALQPALSLWSYVISCPEPDFALLGFGKRDVSFDIDLPVPVIVRRGDTAASLDGELVVFRLNDQHAYVRVRGDVQLAVGDIVGCGISHPCTSFDRWRAIPLVNRRYDVVGAVRTFF